MISKYIFLTATFFILLSNFLNYSYALTPDQIIQLRKAGVSDATIQMMLQQERDAEKANPYEQIGVREIKDKDGNSVTIYSTGRSTKESTGNPQEENVDKAWKMLQNMIIDKRK